MKLQYSLSALLVYVFVASVVCALTFGLRAWHRFPLEETEHLDAKGNVLSSEVTKWSKPYPAEPDAGDLLWRFMVWGGTAMAITALVHWRWSRYRRSRGKPDAL